MPVLRQEPELYDLPAWQKRLAELRSDPSGEFRDGLIEDTEAHVRAIGGDPEKLPAEAQN